METVLYVAPACHEREREERELGQYFAQIWSWGPGKSFVTLSPNPRSIQSYLSGGVAELEAHRAAASLGESDQGRLLRHMTLKYPS